MCGRVLKWVYHECATMCGRVVKWVYHECATMCGRVVKWVSHECETTCGRVAIDVYHVCVTTSRECENITILVHHVVPDEADVVRQLKVRHSCAEGRSTRRPPRSAARAETPRASV